MIKHLPRDNDTFAIIDLGSNSFHLLIARYLNGRLHPIQRIRRKVQLASGLDSNHYLNEQSIKRGLECIAIFADRVRHFPTTNLKAVATATLRLAKNRQDFISSAESILGHAIEVIDGETEASLIYLGASLAIHDLSKRLVIDIGGASTEIIVGDDFDIKFIKSLSVGCVTWRQQFFTSNIPTPEQFDAATKRASELFMAQREQMVANQWEIALSACGTIQTVNEIMLAQKLGPLVTLDILYDIKRQIFNLSNQQELSIKGLFQDKAAVLPSGLSILIALFETFDIKALTPTDGALREGLLASFKFEHQNTLNDEAVISYVQKHYQVDIAQAKRVEAALMGYVDLCAHHLSLPPRIKKLLKYCIALHEVGLAINLKNANQHSSYLLSNFPQLGLTLHEKALISLWFQMLSPQKIKAAQLSKQSILAQNEALILSILIKIAIISCCHREDRFITPLKIDIRRESPPPKTQVPNQIHYSRDCSNVSLWIKIEKHYLTQHPFIHTSLQELILEVKSDIRIKIITH